jgi:putative glycosyltransferase
MTGLEHAKGELVFLIDSDLEEQPELVGRFHSELAQGDWDVVFGYQEERAGGFIRNYGGRLAWYLIDLLFSAKIPRNHCTVRLMRREYVDALLLHRESSVVIGGLWVITGFRQTGLAISKGHRKNTSYTPVRRLAAFLNGVTAFSTTPLVLMALMGTFVSFASFLLGLVVVAAKLINGSAVGWASIMVSIWFIGGIIVSCLGIIGIYISKIFIETKNRPYVIVRRLHQSGAVSSSVKVAAGKTALV